MKRIKIGITGSHSVGKTTFALQLGAALRIVGFNSYVIQERVRFSPYPINQESIRESVLWTYHDQIKEELEVCRRPFDAVVCDRISIDGFIYGRHYGLLADKTYDLDELRDITEGWLHTYDLIVFVRPDYTIPIVPDGFRATDNTFRDKIDSLFEKFINKERLEYKFINNDSRVIPIIETKISDFTKDINNIVESYSKLKNNI